MSLTVADLVQRFDTGGIRLPLMQRDYVWKPKKVVRLLDSLYKGWPIKSLRQAFLDGSLERLITLTNTPSAKCWSSSCAEISDSRPATKLAVGISGYDSTSPFRPTRCPSTLTFTF